MFVNTPVLHNLNVNNRIYFCNHIYINISVNICNNSVITNNHGDWIFLVQRCGLINLIKSYLKGKKCLLKIKSNSEYNCSEYLGQNITS